MLNYKRVLTVTSGLFLLFLFPLYADAADGTPAPDAVFSLATNLSFSAGNLWADSYWWHNGLSMAAAYKKNKMYLDIDTAHLKSNLRWADGFISEYSGRVGFDTPLAGFDFSFGFFNHSLVTLEVAKKEVSNDGGDGFNFGFKTPLHIGKLNVTPSFLYGTGDWDDGNLYWFFGKPDIPALTVYGLAANYEQHSLNCYYASMVLDILSNENSSLFDSHINACALYYSFSLERNSFGFTGNAGWLYANAAVDGALTASNQHYMIFPFVFYRITGTFDMHAAFALLDFQYKRPLFQGRISLGAAHIVYGEGTARIHSQMKKLFGGAEAVEEMPLKTSGLGAAFLLLSAGMPGIRIGGHTRLSWELQKAFIIPWGYEQVLPGQTDSAAGSSPLGEDAAQLIKTELLSGWSLYCSIRF